jgi:transposase
MYKWQKVKVMRTKGLSIKKIAKTLKLSKNTVRKYLRSPDPPQFNVRYYGRMLDQYEEKIQEMLEKKYIGTRIYSELIRMGYNGSLSTVHRHIRGARREAEISEKVTTRVETPLGKQMQYDWKEWNLPIGSKSVRIYIHEVVLSYSREKYYTCSLKITTSDIIRALVEAIDFFGGIASELVIDNSKQMVIVHEKDGIVRYNDEFLEFCGLYGIEPNPCRNYRARTKGKAERPFYFIQEHLLRGLEVSDLSEFEVKLREFRDMYNNRPHSTLKETPYERFLREKEHLRGIPLVNPALLYKRDIKPVSSDGYISYGGGFYPVPMRFALRSVMVESVFGKLLLVYAEGGDLVVEHKLRLFETGLRPEHPEHEEINKGYREKKEAVRSEIVKRFIEAFDDKGRLYIERLRERVSENLYWHLKEIMKYVELYGIDEVSDVLSECINIGTYHKNSVKRLLSSRDIKRFLPELHYHSNAFPSVDIRRELSSYRVEVSYE